MTQRRAQVAAGLDATRSRIAGACATAGRDPSEVTLVVVTKTFPVSDVRLLHELGVEDVGENRHPEAEQKAQECAGLGLTWHYVGQLQTNKAKAVAAYADVVHSIDRARLVDALARSRSGPPLDCLIQVTLDDPGTSTGRGGADPAAVADLAARIAGHEPLRLRGVMAVAPLDADPDEAFGRLQAISGELRGQWPQATWISAGMSGDLEQAVRHGATHVRVGGAILGTRPPAR